MFQKSNSQIWADGESTAEVQFILRLVHSRINRGVVVVVDGAAKRCAVAKRVAMDQVVVIHGLVHQSRVRRPKSGSTWVVKLVPSKK